MRVAAEWRPLRVGGLVERLAAVSGRRRGERSMLRFGRQRAFAQVLVHVVEARRHVREHQCLFADASAEWNERVYNLNKILLKEIRSYWKWIFTCKETRYVSVL